MKALADSVREQVARAVVGNDDAIELMLVALICRGHVLLEGVPGTAKTLLARALARSLDLESARVQFTPDMLPSDITGTMTLRDRSLEFRPGPVFTNILLADEVNRTPPKTQSALLEAMQEGQVTVEGEGRALPDPFLVVATQNPVEYEGTYPLPEAQLDRFLVRVDVGYPEADAEREIVRLGRRGVQTAMLEQVEAVADGSAIDQARAEVDKTTISDEVAEYLVSVVRRTRELPSVELGASPRAAVHLLAACSAVARLAGRDYVTPDDVSRMAQSVLAHRLVLSPDAALERFGTDEAVDSALADVPVPR
ncbi:MAG: AAA family ATPase [Solirubrobacterales bacterium]